MKDFRNFCLQLLVFNGYKNPYTGVKENITLEAEPMFFFPGVVFLAHRLRSSLMFDPSWKLRSIVLAIIFSLWNIGALLIANGIFLYYYYSRHKYQIEIIDDTTKESRKKMVMIMRIGKLVLIALLWVLLETRIMISNEFYVERLMIAMRG